MSLFHAPFAFYLGRSLTLATGGSPRTGRITSLLASARSVINIAQLFILVFSTVEVREVSLPGLTDIVPSLPSLGWVPWATDV